MKNSKEIEFDLLTKKVEAGMEILKRLGPFEIENPVTGEIINVNYEDVKKDMDECKEIVRKSRQIKFRNGEKE